MSDDPEIDMLLGDDEEDEGPILPDRVKKAMDKLLSAKTDKVARGRENNSGEQIDMDIARIHNGVTTMWLAQALHMDPAQVKRELGNCPALARRKSGFIYDLKTALGYLIKPVMNVEDYIKNMDPRDLPTKMQQSYWAAANARQKWEQNAGHLWHTDDVVSVLGETFQMVKHSLQLWADNLERTTGLTENQREILQGSVDGLQDEITQKLREMPMRAKKPRRPQLAEEVELPEAIDDDYTQLI